MAHLFCFGLSYTARALVAALNKNAGDPWKVTATARQDEGKRQALAHVNMVPFDSEESRSALLEATHILSSVPPSRSAHPQLDPVLAVCAQTLAAARPAWTGYLSTTGPYGDCGGAWVDESAPNNPSGDRGKRRIEAEEAWKALAKTCALPLHIFRLPGLYGPGRSTLDKLRDGTARRIVKKGQYFSRIHIDDLAAILKASMQNPRPGALYNVADDEPAPPQDVTAFAANLLGVPVPPDLPFDSADLTPMARSFYGDNKRISNALIKSELGVKLKYPTYREGLQAILDQETS